MPAPQKNNETGFAGRWIARVGGQIVAQGGTPNQAYQIAKASRPKEIPQVAYSPGGEKMNFPETVDQIRAILPQGQKIYLVGGAIRDALLQKPVRDLDFVLPERGIDCARRVANTLGASFYPLDGERDSGRVILMVNGAERMKIDFSVFQGATLEEDLQNRDFTINSMAVDLDDPQALLDPLGGARDLYTKVLRACSSRSMQEDAIRVIRGMRFAAQLNLKIHPETRAWMRQAAPLLKDISKERKRDEVFRILEGKKAGSAIRALEMLRVLPHALPFLQDMQGVEQSPPHVLDVWNHTLDVLLKLEAILDVLALHHHEDSSANLHYGLLAMRIGRYREQIAEHFQKQLNPDHSLRSLLFLAALYHDSGKPSTKTVDASGRIRFFQHEEISEEIVRDSMQSLALSNAEQQRVRQIVRHHMRPFLLAKAGKPLSRRAVYRFFRDAGEAGVDVCLLSLADILATYGASLPTETWNAHLDVVRELLEAYWEKNEETVSPAAWINGDDLQRECNLSPGPLIGEVLEAVREAQAGGSINSRQEALQFAQNWLKQKDSPTEDV